MTAFDLPWTKNLWFIKAISYFVLPRRLHNNNNNNNNNKNKNKNKNKNNNSNNNNNNNSNKNNNNIALMNYANDDFYSSFLVQSVLLGWFGD